nr:MULTISPECIES: HD-GYP domain-containing protein [unclassified Fusibacter]
MNALARAAEGNDDVTGHHIRRVNYYSKLIARSLGMDTKFVKSITVAAQMHDVGKINTPDSVLNKPGKLTDQEFALMQAHTVQGQIIIGDSEDLEMAANIARSHHEKYDGTGYPDKLKGDAIPLEARIVFLADIYDALRSERPYKRGFTHEEAYEIIVNGDGRVEPTHFDPDILSVFIERHKAFEKIFATYSD